MNTSTFVQPATMIALKPAFATPPRVAAEQRVRGAGGQPVVPGDEIPDDRAGEAREDHREGDDGEVDHAAADGLRDGGAEEEGRHEVEERRPGHGPAGREHPRRDHGGDRVGGVVEAVDEVEDQRDADQGDDGEERGVHG
jgi:hypothetical protein